MTVLDALYLMSLLLPGVPPLHAGVRLEQAQYGGRLARFHTGAVTVPEHRMATNLEVMPGGTA